MNTINSNNTESLKMIYKSNFSLLRKANPQYAVIDMCNCCFLKVSNTTTWNI